MTSTSNTTRRVILTKPAPPVDDRWPLTDEDLTCPACGQHAMDPASTCTHVWCDDHDHWTEVREDHSGPGFAGGTIVHVELHCGAVWHDESDDLAAAR